MTPDPVKKRIQELVPEVMEVKFGCEVLLGINPKIKARVVCYWIGNKKEILTYNFFGSVVDIETRSISFNKGEALSHIVEILGSPITLSVVLRAIETAYKRYKLSNAAWRMFKGSAIELLAQWDLTSDYDQQSEACKQFIGSLLLTHEA